MKFKLEIELGNSGVRTGYDIAVLLHEVADVFKTYGLQSGNIRDNNRNIVGNYILVEE